MAPVEIGESKSLLQPKGSIRFINWMPDEGALLCGIRPEGYENNSLEWGLVSCNGGAPELVQFNMMAQKYGR